MKYSHSCVFLLICGLILFSPVSSKGDNVWEKIDQVLERMDGVSSDTSYVTKHPTRWMLKSEIEMSGGLIHSANGTSAYDTLGLSLISRVNVGAGLSLSYRGISISGNLPIHRLSGRNLDVNVYGERFGFDVFLRQLDTWNVRDEATRKRIVKNNDAKLKCASLNSYYIFNSDRFSYAAAFNQSRVQRRSAGSWLASVSFYNGSLDAGADSIWQSDYATRIRNLKMMHLSFGAGYAHNFVWGDGWLLHLSGQPSVKFLKIDKLHLQNTETGEEFHQTEKKVDRIEVCSVGRLSLVRSWQYYFLSISAVIQTNDFSRKDSYYLSNTMWRSSVAAGIRF